MGRLGRRLESHPLRWIALYYGVLAVLGGVLIALPQAVAQELRFEEGDYFYKRLLNSLFTSVSASTLTGLTVYDVGRDLSRYGQIVVLVLVQGGGLLALGLGGFVALRAVEGPARDNSPPAGTDSARFAEGEPRRSLPWLLLGTLVLEAVGAVAIYSLWPPSVASMSDRGFQSAFHAVNAVCNGGFALWHDNLVRFRGEWRVYAVIAPLFILGSLGSLIFWAGRSRTQRWALLAGLVLLAAPPALLFFTESRAWRDQNELLPREVRELMQPAMADMPPNERAAAAFFQSASARSAGFHTAALDTRSLSPAGAGSLCLLMLIGGSPASTAGGISTVAAAVLFVAGLRRLGGPLSKNGSGPCSREMVRGALRIVTWILGLIVLTSVALLVTERGARYLEVIFESVSAVSNSGLSMGLTQRLSVEGRAIALAAMFAGRVLSTGLAASMLVRRSSSF